MKDFIKRLWAWFMTDKIQELFRYCVIGALTTLVSFGTLRLFTKYAGINPNFANVLSIICAVIFAYVTNKLFVFRTHCRDLNELLREAAAFFAARGVAMLVEAGGFSLLYEVCHLSEMLAKLVISVVIIVLNYVLSKWLVFRKQKKS